MKSDYVIKPKSTVDYVISSHSTLLENNSIHPAFKITDNIYTHEKSNFFGQLRSKEIADNSPSKTKPISITPSPNRYYKDPSAKNKDREDIFLNPSAMYLSKKPIAFNKQLRESQRKKNKSVFVQIKEKNLHKKYNSHDFHAKTIRIPKIKPQTLVPLNEIKALSPRTDITQSQYAKEKHCEALSQIANFCDSYQEIPSPELHKEQKIVMKYSEKMK